jgi:hypothetical protein
MNKKLERKPGKIHSFKPKITKESSKIADNYRKKLLKSEELAG